MEKNLPIIYEEMFLDCAFCFCDYANKKGVDLSKFNISLKYKQNLNSEQSEVIYNNESIDIYASTEKGMHVALAKLLCHIEANNKEFFGLNPKMPYRGLMVDLARQIHPVEYILEYIDECWLNGATHLQLHFTDNESFTLPIQSYPLLSSKGRTYTSEQIELICEYAKKRGIIIVPEVDVPGHTAKFCQSYPELFGSGTTDNEMLGTMYILPATEEVFDALKTIFAEVAQMFPYSPLIHIGGDEAAISAWNECKKTLKYMEQNNIKDIHHMYAEFVKRTCEIVSDIGRTPVVWEGFSKEYNHLIPKNTLVICWEYYYQTAEDLAKSGFTIINASWRPLYIVTGKDKWYFEPEEITKWNPWFWRNWWEKSLSYPDGVTIDKKGANVIGGQLCAWGDGLRDMEDYKTGLQTELQSIKTKLPLLCDKLFKTE